MLLSLNEYRTNKKNQTLNEGVQHVNGGNIFYILSFQKKTKKQIKRCHLRRRPDSKTAQSNKSTKTVACKFELYYCINRFKYQKISNADKLTKIYKNFMKMAKDKRIKEYLFFSNLVFFFRHNL